MFLKRCWIHSCKPSCTLAYFLYLDNNPWDSKSMSHPVFHFNFPNEYNRVCIEPEGHQLYVNFLISGCMALSSWFWACSYGLSACIIRGSPSRTPPFLNLCLKEITRVAALHFGHKQPKDEKESLSATIQSLCINLASCVLLSLTRWVLHIGGSCGG